MAPFEKYREACLELVNELAPSLPADEVALAVELIEHNECPERIRLLAFSIVRHGLKVPAGTIARIRVEMDGFIDPADLPQTSTRAPPRTSDVCDVCSSTSRRMSGGL